MSRGAAILALWLATLLAGYLLTLTFITPPTEEAHMVTTALFAILGAQVTCAGIIVWCRR